MPLFRAIGFGVLLLVLQILVPEVFAAFVRLSLTFFEAAERMLAVGIYAM